MALFSVPAKHTIWAGGREPIYMNTKTGASGIKQGLFVVYDESNDAVVLPSEFASKDILGIVDYNPRFYKENPDATAYDSGTAVQVIRGAGTMVYAVAGEAISEAGVPLVVGTDGKVYAFKHTLATSETTITVAADSSELIPAGVYFVRGGGTLQYSTDGGTTWVDLSMPTMVVSDGSNVRINNSGTSSVDAYLLEIASEDAIIGYALTTTSGANEDILVILSR